MLKVESGNGKMVIMASGNLREITTDIASVISDLYGQLQKNDPGSAFTFRAAMIEVICNPHSPVWADTSQEKVGIGITIQNNRLKREGEDNA